MALDDALRVLTEVDARKARVVEMRFFGGLTVDETESALRVDRHRHARLAPGEGMARAGIEGHLKC